MESNKLPIGIGQAVYWLMCGRHEIKKGTVLKIDSRYIIVSSQNGSPYCYSINEMKKLFFTSLEDAISQTMIIDNEVEREDSEK